MKTNQLTIAESYRNRAFDTAGTSLIIVLMEGGYYYVTTCREARRLEKQGYELY